MLNVAAKREIEICLSMYRFVCSAHTLFANTGMIYVCKLPMSTVLD